MSSVAALVLAAGRSTRFRAAGGSVATKLVATLRGEPLVRHVASAAIASSASPVIVVTGHAEAEVRSALAGLEVVYAHNPEFADGLATSLRRGLAAVPAQAEAAMVLLGDMPLVGPEVIDILVEAARQSPEADAIVPVWQGVRGNPVVLNRRLFGAAARLSGDEGARRLLRDPSVHLVEIPIGNAAVALDVDDPESLARANRN